MGDVCIRWAGAESVRPLGARPEGLVLTDEHRQHAGRLPSCKSGDAPRTDKHDAVSENYTCPRVDGTSGVATATTLATAVGGKTRRAGRVQKHKRSVFGSVEARQWRRRFRQSPRVCGGGRTDRWRLNTNLRRRSHGACYRIGLSGSKLGSQSPKN